MMGFLNESLDDEIILINKEFDMTSKFSPEVMKLQNILIDKGYDIGDFGPNGDGVDGLYGKLTKKAHMDLKREIGTETTDDEDELNDFNDVTVIIGGLSYATPSWMKKFISWDSGLLSSLKRQYNVTKIAGFSKGGQTIWNEIDSNPYQYDFIGLIDPSTSKTYYDLPDNVFSLTNSSNWGSYPNIRKNLKEMEKTGVLTKTNSSHEMIPYEFFKKYKYNLV
jgi:hypothetical protein